MKQIPLALLLAVCFAGCTKQEPTIDELLPPGTFNLSTIITDDYGNSTDIAGDWAVFQDPDETMFTNFIRYDQESETIFSVLDNEPFMLEYWQNRGCLPVYDNGMVSQPRDVFLQRSRTRIIYLDGKIHNDYRDLYGYYHEVYGEAELIVVIDADTLTFEDVPNVRLCRIKSFQDE